MQLATQLVQRQSGEYDAADLDTLRDAPPRDDRDAKLKGEGLELIEPEEPDRTNVVDLMAALKKSLGQEKPEEKKKAAPAKKARVAENTRKQPGLKLPIIGGKQDEKAAKSGDNQTFPQAGLIPLPFFPAFDADLPFSLLLEADDAIAIARR